MAPASNEEQFKFLISCIRYSNNGKVDFEEVRKECDICSRGAAAKRYERMMKANGIYQSASSIRETAIPSTKRKASAEANAASPSTKKRKGGKADQYTETNANIDDDEGLSTVKAESFKAESSRSSIKEENIKKEEEPTVVETTPESAAIIKCPYPKTMDFDSADDALFNDFISFGAQSGSARDDAATQKAAPTTNEGKCIPESILIPG